MLVEVAKALADDNRLRIVVALEDRELCVCQLTELLGLATSTVSKHISVLHRAGLLTCRKSGRWMYYALKPDAAPAAASALRWVLANRSRIGGLGDFERRLKRMLQANPEDLCRKQNRS